MASMWRAVSYSMARHVGAHRALFHAGARHLREPQQAAQALEVCHDLVGASQVWLAHDFNQGHAGAVEVHQRGI